MQKKVLKTMLLAGCLSVLFSFASFAGEWKQDNRGWWWQNDDGSYPAGSWQWLDGNNDGVSECYYFDQRGFLVVNSVVEGYKVNGDGAWVENGVVQTQESPQETIKIVSAGETIPCGSLSFTVPEGFTFYISKEDGTIFADASMTSYISVAAQEIPNMAGMEGVISSIESTILDLAVETAIGTPDSKGTEQFVTGSWYVYNYLDTSALGIPGSIRVYMRISGVEMQVIMFMGNIANMDCSGIMNNNFR